MTVGDQYSNRMCVYTLGKGTCEFMNHTQVYDVCFVRPNHDRLLEPIKIHNYVHVATNAIQSQFYTYIHSMFALLFLIRFLAMFSRRV